MFPAKDALNICFAHVAYQMQERFAPRETGIANFQVRDRAGLEARLGEADVLVVSGLWRNDLERVEQLDRRRETILRSALPPVAKIYWLL